MTKNRLFALILSIGVPIVILVVGFSSIGLLVALKPEAEEEEALLLGQPVFVESVRRGNFRLSVEGQGQVRPVRETRLSAEVAGRVIYVSPNLLDGGSVEEGEVLVKIEPSGYNLALAQARSAVASARQVLARVEAEALIARKDWEQLGKGEASDLALRRPQLDEASASLEAAIAREENAVLQLERTRVKAPFRGRVRSRQAELGQYVGPGQVLANIYATDRVEVAVPLSVSQLSYIGVPLAYNAGEGKGFVGEAVLSAFVGDRPVRWSGEVVRTGAAIDSSTRLVSVYVSVEDPFGEAAVEGIPLAPGLFVDIALLGREVEDVWIIPRVALRGKDRSYVARSDSEGAVYLEVREVKVLSSDSGHAYILEGFSEGDRVVVSPVQAVFDGMRLRVIEEDSGAAVADELSNAGAL